MGFWGDIYSTSMDWGVRLATRSQSLSRVPLSNLYPQSDLGNMLARIPLSLGSTQGKLFGSCMCKIGTQRRWEQLSCISCAVKMLRKGLCVRCGRSQINNHFSLPLLDMTKYTLKRLWIKKKIVIISPGASWHEQWLDTAFLPCFEHKTGVRFSLP